MSKTVRYGEQMICICSDNGRAKALQLRLAAMRTMALAAPQDLASAVILSLAFDFGASAQVDADQWCWASVLTTDHELGVECDLGEDGLIWAWLELANRHPDRVTRSVGVDADFSAAEQLARSLMDQLALAYAPRKAHRASIPEEQRSAHWCAVCRELLEPWGVAARALNEMWGIGEATLFIYGDRP